MTHGFNNYDAYSDSLSLALLSKILLGCLGHGLRRGQPRIQGVLRVGVRLRYTCLPSSSGPCEGIASNLLRLIDEYITTY